MSYTPGHDTARFLNRTKPCPVCEGQGSYTAGLSSNGHDTDASRTYRCACCEGRGLVPMSVYKAYHGFV